MKQYTNRSRGEMEEYKVRDLVLFSTKDLKYQIVGRYIEKLTERLVGSYKIKMIISNNTVKLELPGTVRIHSVVNISKIH